MHVPTTQRPPLVPSQAGMHNNLQQPQASKAPILLQSALLSVQLSQPSIIIGKPASCIYINSSQMQTEV